MSAIVGSEDPIQGSDSSVHRADALTGPIKLIPISLCLVAVFVRLRDIAFQELALSLVSWQFIEVVIVNSILCVGRV